MESNTSSKPRDLPVDIRAVRWLLQMRSADRRRFVAALTECSDEVQQTVFAMISVVEDPASTEFERQRAANTIRDALELQPFQARDGIDLALCEADAAARSQEIADIGRRMDSQEAAFAAKLKELLKNKGLTQTELARRVECSQPAVSLMLSRACRPQRQTIIKLAAALDVHPRELWPDLEVADILDTTAAVQQDQELSESEADALRRALAGPPANAPAKLLPKLKS